LGTIHRKIDTGNICIVSNVIRGYLSVSCAQCYPCLSFCILCLMLPVSVFLCLVSNVTRVYLSVSCVQWYTCLSFCVLCPMLPVSIFGHKTQNDRHGNIGHKKQKNRHGKHWKQDTEIKTRATLGTRPIKIDTGNIVLPVSIFLCLVSNGTRVYHSVSCAQCYPCLSFCVLYPMLPVSIFLCLVPNVTRHRKIDTCNIGHKTQKDRYG
jgi:hypothetical protein